MGIYVIAGKKYLRVSVPFCLALQIPKFAALHIKKDFTTQIGAANAKENDSIDMIANLSA